MAQASTENPKSTKAF